MNKLNLLQIFTVDTDMFAEERPIQITSLLTYYHAWCYSDSPNIRAAATSAAVKVFNFLSMLKYEYKAAGFTNCSGL
jgi:hypothetical protein